MIPLFKQYPHLRENLPYISLGSFPTPIIKAEKLGAVIGLNNLYIKNDGVTHPVFGGNKIRKLEFLIGKALKNGHKEVMTFGGAGSNHATATAVCARQVGLKSISMLMPQVISSTLRNNLLMSHHHGAELHLYDPPETLIPGVRKIMREYKAKSGIAPLLIPFGGSNPTGIVGFVNAALELKEQVDAGLLPEPDLIYTAVGTMGTLIGLRIGIHVAGMKTEVVPVRVIDEATANVKKYMNLYRRTRSFLNHNDSLFPLPLIRENDVKLRHDFFGEEYGKFTPEGMEAITLMKESQGLPLEGTYTGKALACLISDARKGKLQGKTVLFWDTYNGNDFTNIISDLDYHELPTEFYPYF